MMFRNTFSLIGLALLGVLAGCAPQGITIKPVQNVKPEMEKKALQKKDSISIEYFRDDLELAKSFFNKEPLTKAEEAQLKNGLKQVLMKKYDQYITTTDQPKTCTFGPTTYHNFPYLLHKNRLDKFIFAMGCFVDGIIPTEKTVRQRLASEAKQLKYIQNKFSSFFAHELKQETLELERQKKCARLATKKIREKQNIERQPNLKSHQNKIGNKLSPKYGVTDLIKTWRNDHKEILSAGKSNEKSGASQQEIYTLLMLSFRTLNTISKYADLYSKMPKEATALISWANQKNDLHAHAACELNCVIRDLKKLKSQKNDQFISKLSSNLENWEDYFEEWVEFKEIFESKSSAPISIDVPCMNFKSLKDLATTIVAFLVENEPYLNEESRTNLSNYLMDNCGEVIVDFLKHYKDGINIIQYQSFFSPLIIAYLYINDLGFIMFDAARLNQFPHVNNLVCEFKNKLIIFFENNSSKI